MIVFRYFARVGTVYLYWRTRSSWYQLRNGVSSETVAEFLELLFGLARPGRNHDFFPAK